MVQRGLFDDETGRNFNARVQISTVDFQKGVVNGVQTSGYDLAGNLLGYVDATHTFTEGGEHDKRITTTITQTNERQNGQTRQSHIETKREVGPWPTGIPEQDIGNSFLSQWADNSGTTTVVADNAYDANGFLVRHMETNGGLNRSFVNNSQGLALYVNQGANEGGHLVNPSSGYLGGYTGDAGNPGNVQRQLIVNGQVLAR